jgi:predicted NBD/HSP70 family sugar kinase
VHIPLADLDFRDWMADRFDLPVAIDNDANGAAIASGGLEQAGGRRMVR